MPCHSPFWPYHALNVYVYGAAHSRKSQRSINMIDNQYLDILIRVITGDKMW
jgi:hypothetical protein